MLIKLYKYIYIFLLVCSFNLLIILNVAKADTINSFKISGNDRITDQTIILFSGIKVNDTVDKNTINKTLKNLYETSFFSDVEVDFENNIIFISVKENPLIQTSTSVDLTFLCDCHLQGYILYRWVQHIQSIVLFIQITMYIKDLQGQNPTDTQIHALRAKNVLRKKMCEK